MSITNGYCTLAELKARLGITDTDDDARLERNIEAASRRIDRMARWRFYLDASATARTYRVGNSRVLLLADPIGTLTGLVVKTDDNEDGTYETTWAASDYVVEPTNALADGRPVTRLTAVNRYWPLSATGRPLVQITARWGWPAVPTDVIEACLLLATRYYKRGDSPEGVVGMGDFGPVRLPTEDADVRRLVRGVAKTVIA